MQEGRSLFPGSGRVTRQGRPKTWGYAGTTFTRDWPCTLSQTAHSYLLARFIEARAADWKRRRPLSISSRNQYSRIETRSRRSKRFQLGYFNARSIIGRYVSSVQQGSRRSMLAARKRCISPIMCEMHKVPAGSSVRSIKCTMARTGATRALCSLRRRSRKRRLRDGNAVAAVYSPPAGCSCSTASDPSN